MSTSIHYVTRRMQMPGKVFNLVFDAAADQHGYVTAGQAVVAGIDRRTLNKMAERGTVQRVSHGVYRLVHFPATPWAQFIEASLWPQGVRGVISHESALAVWGLSDVSPTRVHVTVPSAHRVRRAPPKFIALHNADLARSEVEIFEGFPVTTPERAIRDCHAEHLGPALIRQAIEDGLRTGHLSAGEAQRLERDLLQPR